MLQASDPVYGSWPNQASEDMQYEDTNTNIVQSQPQQQYCNMSYYQAASSSSYPSTYSQEDPQHSATTQQQQQTGNRQQPPDNYYSPAMSRSILPALASLTLPSNPQHSPTHTQRSKQPQQQASNGATQTDSSALPTNNANGVTNASSTTPAAVGGVPSSTILPTKNRAPRFTDSFHSRILLKQDPLSATEDSTSTTTDQNGHNHTLSACSPPSSLKAKPKRKRHQPVLDPTTRLYRSQKHNEAEVRRRQRLNNLLLELAELVLCKKPQKSAILRVTIEKVKNMEKKIQELEQRLAKFQGGAGLERGGSTSSSMSTTSSSSMSNGSSTSNGLHSSNSGNLDTIKQEGPDGPSPHSSLMNDVHSNHHDMNHTLSALTSSSSASVAGANLSLSYGEASALASSALSSLDHNTHPWSQFEKVYDLSIPTLSTTVSSVTASPVPMTEFNHADTSSNLSVYEAQQSAGNAAPGVTNAVVVSSSPSPTVSSSSLASSSLFSPPASGSPLPSGYAPPHTYPLTQRRIQAQPQYVNMSHTNSRQHTHHHLNTNSHPSFQHTIDLIHHSCVPMDLVDLDGHILDCNNLFASFVGYSRAQLLDRHNNTTFFALTHPDSINTSYTLLSNLITTQHSVHRAVKKYITSSGMVKAAILTAWMVHDEAGKPNYIAAIIEPVDHSIDQQGM